MWIFKGLFIISLIFFCALQVGKLWKRQGTYLEAVLLGFTTMLTCFELLSVPLCLLKADFRLLCLLYTLVIAALIIWSLVGDFRGERSYTFFSFRPQISFLFFMAIVLIAVQIGRQVILQPQIYGDDVTYLAMVNDIRSTNVIYGLNPWTGGGISLDKVSPKYVFTSYWQFLAYWCKLFDYHPLLLCKTFLPILYGVLAYGVFFLIGEWLFQEDMKKKGMFLFLVAILVEFGNVTNHSFSRRMLLWTWNNKTVLFTIAMPFLFYLTCKLLQNDIKKREIFMLMSTLLSNGAVSLFAFVISTMMVLIIGIISWARWRNIKKLAISVVACVPMLVVLCCAFAFVRFYEI